MFCDVSFTQIKCLNRPQLTHKPYNDISMDSLGKDSQTFAYVVQYNTDDGVDLLPDNSDTRNDVAQHIDQ